MYQSNTTKLYYSDVLPTVHLSVFILVIDQLNAQTFVLQQIYLMLLHASSICAHHQKVKIILYSLWYHHTETNEWYKITKIHSRNIST